MLVKIKEPLEYGIDWVTGAGEYGIGVSVALHAMLRTGYENEFDGWYVNGVKVSGDNPYTFTVFEDGEIEFQAKMKVHPIGDLIIGQSTYHDRTKQDNIPVLTEEPETPVGIYFIKTGGNE